MLLSLFLPFPRSSAIRVLRFTPRTARIRIQPESNLAGRVHRPTAIRGRGKSRARRTDVFPKCISAFGTSTLGYSYRGGGKSSGSGGSSSGSGNKVCFIFTIPPAKYRPVFPRDIDISGVLGLLLLTPFLHWLGIYVFFLLSAFYSSLSLSISFSISISFSLLSFSPFSLHPRHCSASCPPLSISPPAPACFLSISLLSSPSSSLADGRYSAASPPTHAPPNSRSLPRPRASRTINHARVSLRLQNQPEISIRRRIAAASFPGVLDRS